MTAKGVGDLVERMLAGDRRALARLITLVENRDATVPEIMRRVHGRTGGAYVVGVTGPPGAGKSTLVDRLTATIRKTGATVGVIAVDPTSPFTGGAVLGDRIRMQAHTLDPGVFIRSMATRGSLGGLARATAEVRKLLEAADVLVVNKADREGAPRLMTELRYMVHLHRESQQASRDLDWEVPILAAQAVHGVGIDELDAAIGRHRAALESSGALERRRQGRRAGELRGLLLAELKQAIDRALAESGPLATLLADVEAGRVDPYTAARAIRERVGLLVAPPSAG